MSLVKRLFSKVGSLLVGLRVGVRTTRASDGTLALASAVTPDRRVVIVVKVTETFAAGTGAKPTFKIGETSTTAKFADTTEFSGGVKGDVLVYAGTISGTKDFIVTAAKATGTGAGAIEVEAIILPATA